ncbi:hypothetical protein [Pseudomonas sp. NPDC007930]|uniref:hypothetical protein n=1 Tax=Pseudomonas sp. NPDC007930 TaxID=3364417 RepID=UPI0036E1CC20
MRQSAWLPLLAFVVLAHVDNVQASCLSGAPTPLPIGRVPGTLVDAITPPPEAMPSNAAADYSMGERHQWLSDGYLLEIVHWLRHGQDAGVAYTVQAANRSRLSLLHTPAWQGLYLAPARGPARWLATPDAPQLAAQGVAPAPGVQTPRAAYSAGGQYDIALYVCVSPQALQQLGGEELFTLYIRLLALTVNAPLREAGVENVRVHAAGYWEMNDNPPATAQALTDVAPGTAAVGLTMLLVEDPAHAGTTWLNGPVAVMPVRRPLALRQSLARSTAGQDSTANLAQAWREAAPRWAAGQTGR